MSTFHRSHALTVMTLVAMLCCPQRSNAAEEAVASMFKVNGFGTIGAVHARTDQADFVGSPFQPNGAGFTHRWSPGIDSRLGVQIDAHLNDRFSAVVQLALAHQYDNSYRPQVEWANLKYQFNPDFSLRVGRTVTSLFMLSDSGLVSYTYPWVRPPSEVYGQVPVTHKDGVDVSYRFRAGKSTSSINVSYGRLKAKLPAGGEVVATRYFDINETLEYGPGTFRVAYSSLRIGLHTPSVDTLLAGFTQFGNSISSIPGLQSTGAQAASLVTKYVVDADPYAVLAVAAKYDPGTWLMMAEWAKVNGAATISGSTAWYISGGYQFKRFTPFVTLAQVRSDQTSEPGLNTTALPPALAAAAAALNAGLSALLTNFARSQRSLSAGVRWDCMRNAALKLQYDHMTMGAGSSGRLINVQPGFRPGSNVDLFSTTVDFVF